MSNSNESDGSVKPDLGAILRALQSLAPPQQPPSTTTNTNTLHTAIGVVPQFADLSGATSNSNQAWNPFVDPESYNHVPQHYTYPNLVHQPQSRSQSYAPTPPPIDPATIIDWKQGLRCVSKIAEQSHRFKPSVRKLMADQDKHESMWWQARIAIVQKYGGRESADQASEAAQRELNDFDQKLCHAQTEMVDSFNSELKRLGVPFFGTRRDLIARRPRDDQVDGQSDETTMKPGQITTAELWALQRKMVQHLEDMYKP